MVEKLIDSFWRVVSHLVTADFQVAAAGVGGRGVPNHRKEGQSFFEDQQNTRTKIRNLAIMVCRTNGLYTLFEDLASSLGPSDHAGFFFVYFRMTQTSPQK